MPGWIEVLGEIKNQELTGDPHALDTVRRKYLAELSAYRERNTIAYYSGWLIKPASQMSDSYIIRDEDKNALMATIHKLDRTRGLDLILHTPGGDIAATESIVDYLRQMFGTDIQALIPQLALSAGTMIACACNRIVMGKQSSLGPIDPQLGGIPASGVIEEFERARAEIGEDPDCIRLWQPILAKYHPTLLGECQKSIDWSKEITSRWLCSGMFKAEDGDEKKSSELARQVVERLNKFDDNTPHNRHLPIDQCQKIGLVIDTLEDDPMFQDLLLTVHHSYMHTFAASNTVKIVENNLGAAMVAHPK